LSINLEIWEADKNYTNSITDYLHVIILNNRQERWAQFVPDNPVSTKQYLAPIGPRNVPSKIVIEDVLPRMDQYYLYFVNRGKILHHITGQIVIENSFGHLDYVERYFSFYTQLGVFGHSIEFLVWCTLLWTRRKCVVTVHIFLAVYIFLEVIEKSLGWMYAEKLNRIGDLTAAETGTFRTCQDVSDLVGLLTMLMFSFGYQIRAEFDEKKVRLFAWIAAGFVMSCIPQSFCDYTSYIYYVLFLMRFIFGACLLLGIVWLINDLYSIIQLELNSEPFGESPKLRYLQLLMLKGVKIGFLIYVLAPIVLTSILYSFLQWQDLSILVLIKDLLLLPFSEAFILYNMRPSVHMISLSQ